MKSPIHYKLYYCTCLLNRFVFLSYDYEALMYQSHVADTRGDDGRESAKVVRRVREVVLLTDDRNLRVKALAAELPTRDLPSFVQWAGLSRDVVTVIKCH